MSEYAAGQSVRTLVDILDDYHRPIIPEGERCQVIGFIGPRLILAWKDEELGKDVDAVADPWEVKRDVVRVRR